MDYLKKLKRHDTGEPVRIQVINKSNSQPQDLDNVTAKFIMYQINDDGTKTELVNSAATVETPTTDGYVRYDWSDGDTDEVGTHVAEFELIFTADNNRKETYPRTGYIYVEIEEDLDNA